MTETINALEHTDLKLWYRQPAADWYGALPIGNGRLGAMVFGGIALERLQLNEDTLWSGWPRPNDSVAGVETLRDIRRLILQEADYLAGDELCKKLQGPLNESYQPLGDLFIETKHDGPVEEYRRTLDLRTATATVEYMAGGVHYRRDVFATAVDQVIAMHLTCDTPGRLSICVRLSSPHPHTLTPRGRDRIALRGRCPTHVVPSYLPLVKDPVAYDTGEDARGMRFEALVQVVAEGGAVWSDANGLHVEEADGITLYLSACTSYRGYDQDPSRDHRQLADLSAACEETLVRAAAKPFNCVMADHVADYRALFDRVELTLGEAVESMPPTDERVPAAREGHMDPQLPALFFQFGRYLLISCSRPGSQAANLQGIWNQDVRPMWSCNYTVNINTQMNYWPAEVANLPECHAPLFDLIEETSVSGGDTARRLYGCRGWVAHHNIDAWRNGWPVGDGYLWTIPTIWAMGGAWLCLHLWEHYAFTGDKEFLALRAYPLMRGAATFLLDFLVEDESGYLVTCPSTSPENTFLLPNGLPCAVGKGSTMDTAITHDLMTNCIEASRILGCDASFRCELEKARSRLLPLQTGKVGQLLEYSEDYAEPEPGHRHHSHLYGLFPGRQITPAGTPQMAEACARSLDRRYENGSARGGWPCTWAMALWARLGNASKAYRHVQLLVGSSTYLNLLNGRDVYQIDSNLGGTAGIAEMLLQSHTGEISLLPALPDDWADGSVRGLCARGGFVVDLRWRRGALQSAHVVSRLGGPCRLRTPANVEVTSDGGPVELTRDADHLVQFPTQAGGRYQVAPVAQV